MIRKSVVELDLVGYSDVARTLEENLNAKIVTQFNDQIQGFVDNGLAAVSAERGNAVKATTGDGAILTFEHPADAHLFAVAVHKATQVHNAQKKLACAQRWFRIGIATGDLHERPRTEGAQRIAGTVIANAVRLETAARPGQILIDQMTFSSLSKDIQALYGAEETVPGKRNELFAVRRCTVLQYSAPDDASSVESILGLFDQLNPRDQIDRLTLLLRMPEEHRPPNTLSLSHRKNKILEWADGACVDGLSELAAVLKQLVSKQKSPRK